MSTPFSSQHTSDSPKRSWKATPKGLKAPPEEGWRAEERRQQPPDGSLLGSPTKQRNPRLLLSISGEGRELFLPCHSKSLDLRLPALQRCPPDAEHRDQTHPARSSSSSPV